MSFFHILITKKFMHDARGEVVLEYAMIAVLVSIAIFGGLDLMNNNLETSFQSAANAM